MRSTTPKRPLGIWILSIVAIGFGALTLKAGGSVLFLDGVARQNAGNYVPFVLWFTFIAGFAYIAAGIGLFIQTRWAAWASISIVLGTLIVFSLFGLHIYNGGPYETRTVIAMSLRSSLWAVIAFTSYKMILKKQFQH